MNLMHPLRLAAFAIDQQGGNPAGVVIADHHPTVAEMRQIAADVGYSETVFATGTDGAFVIFRRKAKSLFAVMPPSPWGLPWLIGSATASLI